MLITKKAFRFAIKAHKGQTRKTNKLKPMVIHPIDVGNILKSYGFDNNVIAAGYLHDILEDTKYTENDILKLFGEDITSLVVGDTESDKSLTWEERKLETINKIKFLDLRHKAVICADKISNLEDLLITLKTQDNFDFSCFKRGYKKQKWYYESVYEQLIKGEDEPLPYFLKYKSLLEKTFKSDFEEDNSKKKFFVGEENYYKSLVKLKYSGYDVKKLTKVLPYKVPYIIEFLGTPRSGKTTMLRNLYDFFSKNGFKVEIVDEFTTSQKYKKEIKPLLQTDYKQIILEKIPAHVFENMKNAFKKNADIILIDRGLLDRIVWVNRANTKGKISDSEYSEYKKFYNQMIKSYENLQIALFTDTMTTLKRDFISHLSLEDRTFLNEQNIGEYNSSLLFEATDVNDKFNCVLYDTTYKTLRESSVDIASIVLNQMNMFYCNLLSKILN